VRANNEFMLRTTLDLDDGLSKVSWVAREGWQHGKSVWAIWFVGWQTKEVACGQLRSSWLSLECVV
jgi:NO-binding membrane sensor protein with MHYT domain